MCSPSPGGEAGAGAGHSIPACLLVCCGRKTGGNISRRPLNLQQAPSCLMTPRRNAANPNSAGARHAEVSATARMAESRLALNQQPVIVTFTTPGCYFKS